MRNNICFLLFLTSAILYASPSSADFYKRWKPKQHHHNSADKQYILFSGSYGYSPYRAIQSGHKDISFPYQQSSPSGMSNEIYSNTFIVRQGSKGLFNAISMNIEYGQQNSFYGGVYCTLSGAYFGNINAGITFGRNFPVLNNIIILRASMDIGYFDTSDPAGSINTGSNTISSVFGRTISGGYSTLNVEYDQGGMMLSPHIGVWLNHESFTKINWLVLRLNTGYNLEAFSVNNIVLYTTNNKSIGTNQTDFNSTSKKASDNVFNYSGTFNPHHPASSMAGVFINLELGFKINLTK
jgi:hypothetical protein